MDYYSIRTNDQETIRNVLEKKESITVHQLSWHRDDVKLGDLIYIVISGDKSIKKHEYQNGLRAIGRVSNGPYDDVDPKHFCLNVDLDLFFDFSQTKDDFYIYPALKDCPNIGPETQSSPNQAFRKISKQQGEAVLQALCNILPEKENEIIETFNIHHSEIQKLSPESQEGIPRMEGQTEQHNEVDFQTSLRNLIADLQIDHRTACINVEFKNLGAPLASFLSKKFSIFTGLSGSGKTLMGLCFAKWICPKKTESFYEKLKKALNSDKMVENYIVHRCSAQTVELINKKGDSGKIIPLPVWAIQEWYQALKNDVIDPDTDPKDTRHAVGENSRYQKYIHGFYNDLKKVAMAVLDLPSSTQTKEGPSQYELISVGADWTSNENLLGYPDALTPKSYRKPDNGALDLILRAREDEQNPYFLILDEMNLSHVERYFADFLSAMESGEAISLHDGEVDELWPVEEGGTPCVPGKLKIPENLFVVGTVNVDETTYMFSPKVLDRANVIEFRVSDNEMKSFLENPIKPDLDAIAGQGVQYAKAFVSAATDKNVPLDDETREQVSSVLMEFFPELKEAGAEFGNRVAHEICHFIYFHSFAEA